MNPAPGSIVRAARTLPPGNGLHSVHLVDDVTRPWGLMRHEVEPDATGHPPPALQRMGALRRYDSRSLRNDRGRQPWEDERQFVGRRCCPLLRNVGPQHLP